MHAQYDPFHSAKEMFVSFKEKTTSAFQNIVVARMMAKRWRDKARANIEEKKRMEEEGDESKEGQEEQKKKQQEQEEAEREAKRKREQELEDAFLPPPIQITTSSGAVYTYDRTRLGSPKPIIKSPEAREAGRKRVGDASSSPPPSSVSSIPVQGEERKVNGEGEEDPDHRFNFDVNDSPQRKERPKEANTTTEEEEGKQDVLKDESLKEGEEEEEDQRAGTDIPAPVGCCVIH